MKWVTGPLSLLWVIPIGRTWKLGRVPCQVGGCFPLHYCPTNRSTNIKGFPAFAENPNENWVKATTKRLFCDINIFRHGPGQYRFLGLCSLAWHWLLMYLWSKVALVKSGPLAVHNWSPAWDSHTTNYGELWAKSNRLIGWVRHNQRDNFAVFSYGNELICLWTKWVKFCAYFEMQLLKFPLWSSNDSLLKFDFNDVIDCKSSFNRWCSIGQM